MFALCLYTDTNKLSKVCSIIALFVYDSDAQNLKINAGISQNEWNIYRQVNFKLSVKYNLSRGVMGITLDWWSADPGSNPARCYFFN